MIVSIHLIKNYKTKERNKKEFKTYGSLREVLNPDMRKGLAGRENVVFTNESVVYQH